MRRGHQRPPPPPQCGEGGLLRCPDPMSHSLTLASHPSTVLPSAHRCSASVSSTRFCQNRGGGSPMPARGVPVLTTGELHDSVV